MSFELEKNPIREPRSIQDFLKQSNEIQEEIRKLSNLCEEIPDTPEKTPKKTKKEKEFWEDIKSMLLKHGFNTFPGKVPTLNSISDILIDVLTEYSRLKSSFKELQGLNFKVKKIDAATQPRPRSESSYEPEELRSDKLLDNKNITLDQISNILGVKSYESIIPNLIKIKQVIVTLPGIEKFINHVCNELIPNSNTSDYLDQALLKFKNMCKIQKEFEFILEENSQLKKIVDYFSRLFDVQGVENAMGTIESVFYFVHEMKEFLDVTFMQVSRKLLELSPKAPPSLVMQEFLRKIKS
jgi:hypothetical protein